MITSGEAQTDGAPYALQIPVMFQHCDPAGIVFYPRYFEMINAVVETFFERAVGWSFAEMHGTDRVGVPLGRIGTEFHAASRLGDVIDWTLAVRHLGGASMNVEIAATCEGEARLSAEAVLILVDLDRMRSIRWPEARRAVLETFVKETET
ncbi:acyl-CoA thioesterase [Roseivivax halodurans]|nr:thioesterase family protein [Roseivivax halodurans]